MKVGVLKENEPGEQRVALVPEVVASLYAAGAEVLVETGAGEGARFPDDAYGEAGAAVVPRPEVLAHADILVCVTPPESEVDRSGLVLLGLLRPGERPERVRQWVERGVTAVSLDRLPRQLSRAQSMDVLSSQANVAGYKAVLVAANAYGSYFPMLMTAAGTVKPATVLVLGAGVAGLQALGTARRLGAMVTGYDVRPETKEDVRSVGARFLELEQTVDAGGTGGYARELTDEERQAQQHALDTRIGSFDVVITTAAVPGRRPPVLVTEEAVKGMRAGSVVVDTACGPLGGNVAGSEMDTEIVTPGGVIVIGAGNLPSAMASAASRAYARNIRATLDYLCPDGELRINLDDEVQNAIVLTHGGLLRGTGGTS